MSARGVSENLAGLVPLPVVHDATAVLCGDAPLMADIITVQTVIAFLTMPLTIFFVMSIFL